MAGAKTKTARAAADRTTFALIKSTYSKLRCCQKPPKKRFENSNAGQWVIGPLSREEPILLEQSYGTNCLTGALMVIVPPPTIGLVPFVP